MVLAIVLSSVAALVCGGVIGYLWAHGKLSAEVAAGNAARESEKSAAEAQKNMLLAQLEEQKSSSEKLLAGQKAEAAAELARQYALQEDIAEYLQNPHPLLAALLECEIPYCSPGGKSTLLPFSLAELNRKFQA